MRISNSILNGLQLRMREKNPESQTVNVCATGMYLSIFHLTDNIQLEIEQMNAWIIIIIIFPLCYPNQLICHYRNWKFWSLNKAIAISIYSCSFFRSRCDFLLYLCMHCLGRTILHVLLVWMWNAFITIAQHIRNNPWNVINVCIFRKFTTAPQGFRFQ